MLSPPPPPNVANTFPALSLLSPLTLSLSVYSFLDAIVRGTQLAASYLLAHIYVDIVKQGGGAICMHTDETPYTRTTMRDFSAHHQTLTQL